MRGDERHVFDARAGACDEYEVDGHDVLADDPQARHRGERILCGGDAPVDRVLDRDHRGIRRALGDIRERLADIAHRPPDLAAGLRHLRERRLCERAGRAQVAVRATGAGCIGLEGHRTSLDRRGAGFGGGVSDA